MNIDQLEYILEVAKVKSISAASNNLHVTLPAISQSITHLENELGVKLFTRSRQGTFPIAEGIILIDKASEIIEKVKELREEAQSFTNTISGELRIATIPGPMSLLVKTIAAFKQDYPKVKVVIEETHSLDMLNSIHQDKIDLGLIILYEDLEARVNDFVFTKVVDTSMLCCVSQSSSLALRKYVTPEELQRYPLALYKEDYISWYVNRLANQYGPMNIMFTTNNTSAIRQALREEMAITLGVDFTFVNRDEPYLEGFRVINIRHPGDSPVPLGWIRAKNKSQSRIIKAFTNRLKIQLG
ncbi:LysR family transcriptional regulator [Paenibacillus sp. YAF4_2]|uniref:LysR family transcriptional regulator n=1 Tax=Paenibacillus sp. YAF4_2 TaxID=3233085 RepID=UPI003F9BD643